MAFFIVVIRFQFLDNLLGLTPGPALPVQFLRGGDKGTGRQGAFRYDRKAASRGAPCLPLSPAPCLRGGAIGQQSLSLGIQIGSVFSSRNTGVDGYLLGALTFIVFGDDNRAGTHLIAFDLASLEPPPGLS